jgi:ribonuclease T2
VRWDTENLIQNSACGSAFRPSCRPEGRPTSGRNCLRVCPWAAPTLFFMFFAMLLSGSVFASGTPGQFDYYVLALSWSPEHCAERPSDSGQCGRPLGFVLHGLWPQYERGYPSDCTRQPAPKDAHRQFPGLYPSHSLFYHEWKKHGTCSGLSPESYYALSQKARRSIAIPAAYHQPKTPFRNHSKQLKADFAQANSRMNPESLAVFCRDSGRFMREVLVCLDKKGEHAVKCSTEVDRKAQKSCAGSDFLVRSVR